MKNKLYYFGLITLAMIILGSLFKIMHYPGAAVMLVLGIALFVLAFLPLALRSHFQVNGRRFHFLYVITWLTCFIVFSSMLFKLLHWPGAGILLAISLPFPFVVFLPVFLYSTSRMEKQDIFSLVAVLLLLAGISVFSALLSLNVAKSRIANSLVLSEQWHTVREMPRPPAYIVPGVSGAVNTLLKRTDEIRTKTLEKARADADLKGREFLRIRAIDSRNLAWKVVNEEGVASAISLGEAVGRLVNEIEKLPGSAALTRLARNIFDYEEIVDEGAWAEQMFADQFLSWVLVSLDGLDYYGLELEREAVLLAGPK